MKAMNNEEMLLYKIDKRNIIANDKFIKRSKNGWDFVLDIYNNK